MIRLHKFMADAGVASRRKCEEYIKDGLVTVNGATAGIGQTIDPDTDVVMYKGEVVVNKSEPVVIMLNKPRGVLSTCSDPEGRRTTSEFFEDLPYRVYNVGRLDYDSDGLLLLTNDGDFAYKMMHPKFQISKTYKALTDGILTHDQVQILENGVMLDDGMTSPANVFGVEPRGENTALYITIHEGKNRQVRRMLEAVGHRTLRLRRVAIGNLKLSGLRAGEWRFLTKEEIDSLVSSENK